MAGTQLVFPNWYYYELLNGALIGSEHPENLRTGPAEKLEITRTIAERLVSTRAVRTVLNLTEREWTYAADGLAVVHLPMSDRYIHDTAHETLERAVRCIHEDISVGRAVWVHCQGGIDRTGCVVGCYLVATGQDADGAIAAVKDHWPERRKRNPVSHESWEPVAARIRAYAARSPRT
jgi:hypothetical protein